MCRVFYLFGEKKEIVKKVALYLVKRSFEERNQDGYFYASENKDYLRTLDFEQYINSIKNSNFTKFFAHLRLATSEINANSVHGWKFDILNDIYYCAHNGVLGESRNGLPDSYWFYKNIENVNNYNELIKKIEKYANENSGHGVFMAVNQDFSKLLLINIRTNSYCYELEIENEKVIILSSKRDIIPKIGYNKVLISETITTIKRKKNMKEEILTEFKVLYNDEFVVNKIKEIELRENKLWVINLENSKKEFEKKLNIREYYYVYSNGRGEYYWRYRI